jgi:hypothetical protein
MKILIFIYGIFLLSGYCTYSESRKSNIEIKVMKIDKMESESLSDPEDNLYTIKIDLMNNSNTELSFWTMTCSWDQNWTSDSPSMQFANKGCDINFPHVIHLKSGNKCSFNGIISVSKNNLNKNQEYKLGFLFVAEREYKILKNNFTEILVLKFKKHKDIIWSKPFKLNN